MNSKTKPEDKPILTTREREVLGTKARGLTTQEAAGHLHVTEAAINFHLQNIYRKLGVRNLQQALIAVDALAKAGKMVPLRGQAE